MDRCLRSRSASTARDEDEASLTSDSATQERTLSNEPGLNARTTETNTPEGVDLFKIRTVISSRDESPVLVHQLQSIFATFMTAMQAEKTKLASNLESKLNKLSDNLNAKLASVSGSSIPIRIGRFGFSTFSRVFFQGATKLPTPIVAVQFGTMPPYSLVN